MRDKILIADFIKDKNIGSVASVSSPVIKKMLNKIDFSLAETLVEFGPGNGVITKRILAKMNKTATLYVFETNVGYIDLLVAINDSRLVIIHQDAENATKTLKENFGVKNADYVISSIPFTFINRNKRKRIINNSHKLLRENGKFITYQYSWLIYNLLQNQFSKSSIKFGLLNIPPAFILEGLK